MKEILNEQYSQYLLLFSEEKPSKLEFLAEEIFDFTTYDSEISCILANNMLEVIKSILNKNQSKYFKKKENYINYITMVNMSFLYSKLEWGTSIRSAWFNEYCDGGHYEITNDWKIPCSDINIFMKNLIDWILE